MNASTPVTVTASYSSVNATFGLTISPVAGALSSVSVNPKTIVSDKSATGTVTLTAAAGSGGATVSLSSSNTAAASVPSSVTVPQGSTTATFTVSAGSVTASTPVTVTASYSSVNATFGLTINPAAAALSSVSVNPSTIVSGQSGTGTVALTTAAGSGGITVSLSSSNTAAASVPSSVTIPQGSASATFTVSTGSMSTSTTAILVATYSGVNATVGVTVTPASVSTPTASFQGMDTTTEGNWTTNYNYPNVTIIGDASRNPTVTPVPSDGTLVVWNTAATNIRALQNLSGSGRTAAAWRSTTGLFVDIDFTDQAVHQVAIYCLDENQVGRVETLSLLNAQTNAVLDTRSVSDFTTGVYVLWNVTGHVKLQVTKVDGTNAVISGVFLN